MNKITYHNFLLCVIRRTAARWQHIARYSQCILFTARIYVCRYISEQKATFGRPAGAGGRRAAGGGWGGRPTHTDAQRAHTRAAPRPCVSNERARQATDSTYSYYYERRNAFCRARTKFVLLPIIKIVNAFQFAEVCGSAHRCRAFKMQRLSVVSRETFVLRD